MAISLLPEVLEWLGTTRLGDVTKNPKTMTMSAFSINASRLSHGCTKVMNIIRASSIAPFPSADVLEAADVNFGTSLELEAVIFSF